MDAFVPLVSGSAIRALSVGGTRSLKAEGTRTVGELEGVSVTPLEARLEPERLRRDSARLVSPFGSSESESELIDTRDHRRD